MITIATVTAGMAAGAAMAATITVPFLLAAILAELRKRP